MKKLLIFGCCFFLSLILSAQTNYWQQELQYRIDVSLDDKEHSVDGFLRLQYKNQSPDTLRFIWFHLWPNAYKTDRTAFSEQLLQNGRTDFYFSSKDKKGYINRLDFRANNVLLKTEDHPLYIDLVKVILNEPLPPGSKTEITTPFHVKLPYSFSRSGHVDQSYQLTQWYPKPAVYDKNGWHPMPYLELGEYYGEFANYDVRITVPENYVVAATGNLQNESEKKWLLQRNNDYKKPTPAKSNGFLQPKPSASAKAAVASTAIESSIQTKTLIYLQDNVHDFAWFADKYFTVLHDSVRLASGKIVDAYSFFTADASSSWKKSLSLIKDAIHFRSASIGDYPFNTVSVVRTPVGVEGGMEYPTITNVSDFPDEKTLDLVIQHEIGHNWFYAALGNNERDFPWMDEGLNTFYDERYEKLKYGQQRSLKNASGKMPENTSVFLINGLARQKLDQPISTPSAEFTETNYGLVAYYKTAWWLSQVEKSVGSEKLNDALQTYYDRWKFKHPQPSDLLEIISEKTGLPITDLQASLEEKGKILDKESGPRKIKPAFIFNFRNSSNVSYINFMPILGYNKYDGLMLGGLVHNLTLPANKFQYLLAPLYATSSGQLNGIGAMGYSWFPEGKIAKVELGIGGQKFSFLKGSDSNGIKVFGGYYKLSPGIRVTFRNGQLRSTREKWVEWKTFLIGERGFVYNLKSSDSAYYPSEGKTSTRYINQLSFNLTDYRALYPYDLSLQIQQGSSFYRANLTGNYFLNYVKGGGASVRVFAAKFGYLGGKTTSKEFETFNYQPKLTAVRGNEDYTYSNYFVGRNENEGFASQQIMMRDGGLKLRTDLFQGLQGRSDNWIAAINLNTSIPSSILPKFIPLKLFLDIGTYADAWKKDANTRRFLFVGGVQLSIAKGLINVYAPLVYSSEFSDNLKSVPEENKFFRKISFSIDVHRFNLRKLTNNKYPL